MKRIAETLGIARQTWPSRQSPHPAGGAVARHNRTRNCWPRSKRSLPGAHQTCVHPEGQRQTAATGHLDLAGSGLHDSGMPTYGYRRVHALIRRRHREHGGAAVNAKRVYRVMKGHGLLLEPHRQRHGAAA